MLNNKNVEVTIRTSTSSNQFMPDNLELPDDTFRMSLDNFSMIGENVTIGREVSVDSSVAGNAYTPTIELSSPLPTPLQTPDLKTADIHTSNIALDTETRGVETADILTPDTEMRDTQTPNIETPDGQTPDIETPEARACVLEIPDAKTTDSESADCQFPDIATPEFQTPPPENNTSPPIVETPKLIETKTEIRRPQTLLKLSLTKKSDNDLFVKPSPVLELMSPARMLQFEVEASSSTPTMKRAAVDFDFFSKNNFEKYFVESEPKADSELEDPGDGSTYKETPVIVKADTVRHEIGYGK